MPYNTSSLYATVEMFLVITSSLVNGPIVDFSCSFQATRSLSASAWIWGESTQSISQINRLGIVSSSLTGSDVSNYLFEVSRSSHVNIVMECDKILSNFFIFINRFEP